MRMGREVVFGERLLPSQNGPHVARRQNKVVQRKTKKKSARTGKNVSQAFLEIVAGAIPCEQSPPLAKSGNRHFCFLPFCLSSSPNCTHAPGQQDRRPPGRVRARPAPEPPNRNLPADNLRELCARPHQLSFSEGGAGTFDCCPCPSATSPQAERNHIRAHRRPVEPQYAVVC